MKRLLPLVLVVCVCGCSTATRYPVPAEDNAAVEAAVRGYIKAFQDQRWEDLVSFMHPETLKHQRDAVLADWPQKDEDVREAQRPEIDSLLKAYGVSTVKDARKMPPKELVARMLKRNGESPTMQALKKAQTTIKGISIQRTSEGTVADASMVSRFGEKEVRGVSHFLLERFNGHYLVVYMTKTRHEEEH